MGAITTRIRLSAEDKAALVEYWKFLEPNLDSINQELRDSLATLPEWAPLLRSMSPQQMAERDKKGRELQKAALLEGNWAPYLEDLREQGVGYAKMGVSFIAWYDIIAIYREVIRRRLIALGQENFTTLVRIGDGMSRALDIAMSHLGEAYLSAKEQIISQQQEAIRELSMPILQVKAHLLVVPLVGVLDSTRARHLIESLLGAIRDRRANGVVIDVTGVPIVDTAVANHLVQACDAARLMGATVAITGISPDMAQTLVALGAKLPAASTLIDLQEGLEEIERLLATQPQYDVPSK